MHPKPDIKYTMIHSDTMTSAVSTVTITNSDHRLSVPNDDSKIQYLSTKWPGFSTSDSVSSVSSVRDKKIGTSYLHHQLSRTYGQYYTPESLADCQPIIDNLATESPLGDSFIVKGDLPMADGESRHFELNSREYRVIWDERDLGSALFERKNDGEIGDRMKPRAVIVTQHENGAYACTPEWVTRGYAFELLSVDSSS